MSVNLESQDKAVSVGICNGTWLSIVELARAVDPSIPDWNGHHDGQVWSPDDLRTMAVRIQEATKLVDDLYRLANHGGATLS